MDEYIKVRYVELNDYNSEISYKLWDARLTVNPLKSNYRSEPDLQKIIDILARDDDRSKIKESAK